MAKLQNWSPEDWGEGAIKRRPYQDKTEYLKNQQDAFVKREKAIKRFDQDVERFTKNFSEIPFLIDKRVLCLGARTGAEVKALRDLGNTAYGLDLEPVTNNFTKAFVLKGDFHDLSRFTDKFDVVYTNSFDHVFDLEKALNEVSNVLKDDGRFILEVVAGYEEGGHPGDHEAMYWAKAEDFVTEVEKYGFARTQPIQSVSNVKGLPFSRAILAHEN